MKRIQVSWEAGLLGLIGIEIGLAIAYATSVWLHGEAGASLARKVGEIGFLAREIPDEIPALMAG